MKIRFQNRETANKSREKHESHLADADDRRRNDVFLDDGVPNDVVDEAQEMAEKGHVDYSPPDDVQEDVDDQDLSGKQLGALRRAWGAYIGGVSQAEEAFATINDVRDDVNQEPLSFEDLYNEPRDSTELLLEQLALDPEVVPGGHTTEEFAEIVRSDTTSGRVPEEDVLEHLDREGVTMSPEELEGVGSAGVGQMSLEDQLEAETPAEREVIAEDLELANRDLEKSLEDEEEPERESLEEPIQGGTGDVLFTLEADTSAVIKPVLNAAQRHLGTARVEMTPEGIRIVGSSPDMTSFIDTDVDPATFDTFQIDNPGPFETDIGKWWDAYQGERKTDPTRIVAKIPEYDSLEDIKGIHGSRMVEILEDNGIRTARGVRNADVEDLTGSVEFEVSTRSGTKTRTTEIDEEKARKLKKEVSRPYVIIEVDGEDVIDGTVPDSYPRVREPTEARTERIQGFPEADDTGKATLNARDFSKTVRAADEVADSMFFAIAEGELVMFADGDTDEIHATPDADVVGSEAGGLYSLEKVDDLRLSIDRKASTDLTLWLPDVDNEGTDEDVKEFDGAPLLMANYPIAKGDGHAAVTRGQAPRIPTDEDALPERARWDHVRPSAYEPLEDVRYEAVSDAGNWKGWFRVLSAHADECRLDVDGDGLSTMFVDPANVVMVDADLKRSAFDDYVARGPAGRLRDQGGTIGLPQERVLEYLKKHNKRDEVRIKVDRTTKVAIESDRFTAVMPTIDPDSVRRRPNFPELDVPARSVVDATSITEGIEAADDVSDHVALIVYEGQAYLYADGDLEDDFIDVEEVEEGVGSAASLYSLDYLDDHLSAIPSGGRSTLEIVLGDEFPTLWNYSLFGADLTMMLAPRVKDENLGSIEGAKEALEERGMDPDRLDSGADRFTINPEGSRGEVATKSPEREAAA